LSPAVTVAILVIAVIIVAIFWFRMSNPPEAKRSGPNVDMGKMSSPQDLEKFRESYQKYKQQGGQ